MNKKILVIGAGVSGLSTAKLLLDSGYSVDIWAKDLPQQTTSNVAAAFWYPYLCNPRDKVIGWSKFTLNYLKQHAVTDTSSGTRLMSMTEYFDKPEPDPWWLPAVDNFSRPKENELPPGYVDGHRTEVVLMDTSLYLPWLMRQIENSGGRIKQHPISSFDEVLEAYDTVINCTGLGSKELCKDERLYPVRGQVVCIKPRAYAGIMCDDKGPNHVAYIVPRFNDLVLGGTAQEHDWNLEVDPQDTADILRKAAAISPLFNDVEIVKVKVGLRPARDEVRLEVEQRGRKHIIHNYGHGGAGYTISWGCANQVVQFIENIMPRV
jgi:D-amino-acid oxidase